MHIRVASMFFALTFVFAALPAHAQGPGGPPPNYRQLAEQLAALTAQVTALQGQVAKLEGNIVASDLAGTYSLTGLETTMRAFRPGPPIQNANIDTAAYRGTITLNADGTGNGSAFTCEGSRLTLGTGAMNGFDCSEPGGTGDVTWTYANGVITITFLDDGDELPFNVALGGRLLTVAFAPFHASEPSSNQVLLILTRLR